MLSCFILIKLMMKKTFTILSIASIIIGCGHKTNTIETDKLKTENDSLKTALQTTNTSVESPVATFLTFQESNAEEAMNFYISLFDNSEVIEVQKYGNEGPAPEGSIMVAKFKLNGQNFMCSDSPIKHEWNFTPGVSVFIDCDSDEQLESLFAKLSENGQVFMPLNNYGFSQKFGFVEDKFGVSWQLNLQ